MLPFQATTDKIAQAAGILLGAGPLPCSNLLDLLYLADRESLMWHGHPILGGRIHDSKDGPRHQDVCDLLFVDSHPWSQYIHSDGTLVSLASDPGWLGLCLNDVDILKRVRQRFGNATIFPVYPEAAGSGEFLTLEFIMGYLGFSADAISHVAAEAAAHAHFCEMLAAHR